MKEHTAVVTAENLFESSTHRYGRKSVCKYLLAYSVAITAVIETVMDISVSMPQLLFGVLDLNNNGMPYILI